jgi:hypothetical protein
MARICSKDYYGIVSLNLHQFDLKREMLKALRLHRHKSKFPVPLLKFGLFGNYSDADLSDSGRGCAFQRMPNKRTAETLPACLRKNGKTFNVAGFLTRTLDPDTTCRLAVSP